MLLSLTLNLPCLRKHPCLLHRHPSIHHWHPFLLHSQHSFLLAHLSNRWRANKQRKLRSIMQTNGQGVHDLMICRKLNPSYQKVKNYFSLFFFFFAWPPEGERRDFFLLLTALCAQMERERERETSLGTRQLKIYYTYVLNCCFLVSQSLNQQRRQRRSQ